MLVEIAKKKGDYTPDLSFGTHFFQDLVEAKIRYLPLYPDEEDGFLNERLIKSSKNLLPELLPEFAEFSDFITVVNLAEKNEDESLIVLMNAEENEGIGLIIDKEGIKSKYYRTKRNRISSTQINTPEMLIDALVVGMKSSCYAAKKLFWTMKSENTISLGVVLTSIKAKKDFEKWLQGWENAFNLVGGKKGGKTGFKIDLAVIAEKSADKVLKHMQEISDNVNEINLEEE
jgi:hypothetical protein